MEFPQKIIPETGLFIGLMGGAAALQALYINLNERYQHMRNPQVHVQPIYSSMSKMFLHDVGIGLPLLASMEMYKHERGRLYKAN